MLSTIISKLGVPFLVSLLGGALASVNNPVAQSASNALRNFEGAMASGAVTAEQMEEANRHAEKMAELKSKEFETAMTEINQTIRAESASSDAYVRRMRPTFGYLMAVTWAAQMLGLAYIVVFETEKAAQVLDSMEALSTIWAMGLSVLGIYVYKRSEEKKKIFAMTESPRPAAAKVSAAKPAAAKAAPIKVND